jgi:cell division protein FtsQ
MAIKINIRKIFSLTLWCAMGAGVLVLLVAAIGYRNNKTCKGYRIDISGPSGILFIDKRQIVDLLSTAGTGKWVNKPTATFDLRRMESVLEKNVWIKDAQLFFDNNGILRVNITEREPIARIFTVDGNSFYIDTSGAQLPLSDKLTTKLPVFTDYPAPKIRMHGQDSLLTVQIRQLSTFIRSDSFWMAQIAQLDITPDKRFELVPTIGNHLIGFGDGNDYEAKFHRLFVFYKQVLSRTGFDKYSRVDVAYAGQVIGTRKGSEGSRQDSLQGMRNIREMIHAAQHLQSDTLHQREMRPLENPTQTEQTLTNYDLIPSTDSAGRANPASVNNPPVANPPMKPKAIMPNRQPHR